MSSYNLSVAVGDDNLIFKLIGRIDSNNAEEIRKAVMLEREKHSDGNIIFDCERLEYISSAGLRIFLSLLKSEKARLEALNIKVKDDKSLVKLINVNKDVNDILDVTNFKSLFKISRVIRDVSALKAKKLGYLGCIEVYSLEGDMLLKVYPENTLIEIIERERELSQAAFAAGVPTLIAYDIVKYKGRFGMLYELIKANTLLAYIENAPAKLEGYASEMGKLLKIIHEARPDGSIFRKTSELYKELAIKAAQYLTPDELHMLLNLINAVPEADTLVYGNFSERNIFVRDNELILINMSGASVGNPVYDLGGLYLSHILDFENKLPTRQIVLETLYPKIFWNYLIIAYAGTQDASKIKDLEEIIRPAALIRLALSPLMLPLSPEAVKRIVEYLREDLFANYDKYINLLKKAKF